MSSVLVVGSIALDTIETPAGRRDDVLGGSATMFALSAKHFAPVRVVGVVGQDFPRRYLDMLRTREIDVDGVEIAEGKTFRWHGRYAENMSSRETVSVQLNVLGNFQPKIPAGYRETEFVFLGNGSPVTQGSVLNQIRKPRFVMLDSMNLWIENDRANLMEQLKRVDAVCLNEEEAYMLSGLNDLKQAASWIARHGPKTIVIKQAERGASLFHEDRTCTLPAYRVETVLDPTGAGDSFAGGFMGSLAQSGEVTWEHLQKALTTGAVMGSFNVEDFGTARLERITADEIRARFDALRKKIP